jgi:hypothetical protein
MIRPKRNQPLAEQFFLNFPAGSIAEIRLATLVRIVGNLAENVDEFPSWPRREGENVLGHPAIQNVAVTHAKLSIFALQFPVLFLELFHGYFVAGIHGLHSLIDLGSKFALFFLLQFGEECRKLKAFVRG